MQQPADQKLLLEIQVEANPPADIHWLLDGGDLAQQLARVDYRVLSDRNQSKLIVEPPVPEGLYSVEASNAHGTVKSGTNVCTR